jgi:hypothetical protein
MKRETQIPGLREQEQRRKKNNSKNAVTSLLLLLLSLNSIAQLKWQNVDSLYGPLPSSVHVYRTTGLLDGKPNIAYYVEADIKDKHLFFNVDTTHNRRWTPTEFYLRDQNRFGPEVEREHINYPLVVVNTTFFSFATNQSLNAVIQNGKLTGYNIHTINGRGKDTFTYRHPFVSAIGIDKRRNADIAWLYTDSSSRYPLASQFPVDAYKDSSLRLDPSYARNYTIRQSRRRGQDDAKREVKAFHTWKMKTAVGGGPVLLQEGKIQVTNNEEIKFAGKAIDDKHPRTAMGYTQNNKLIILVIEGRNPGKAEGATLTQEAQIFKDLGCVEALNLDGGGSSCMLVNGKETIKVSDGKQRPVPAVFTISR